MKRVFLVVALLALNGCAYYNGMYNANRLAGRAEHAERDGRTFDANSYWGQVIVKADSVLARHPDSKWADDARLLRGKALARLDRCAAAIPELNRAQQELSEPHLIEEASLELGRCHLDEGDAASAQIALARVQDSPDSSRRVAARGLLGRARVAQGDYEGALAFLDAATDSTSAGNRLVALAGAGRLDAARALADTLIAARSVAAPWGAFLRELGEADPASASSYLDRLATLEMEPAQLAGWLLDDANRLLAVDYAAAVKRLETAELKGAGTEPGTRARNLRLRLALGRVPGLDSLGPLISGLQQRTGDVGLITATEGLLGTAELVRRTADSALTRPPHGDLMLFLAAELARDSLGANQLAADLMRRVASTWPESPYAPKALLALMALDRSSAEAARADLEILYAASPYVAAIQGVSDSTYHVLEDSLGTFAVEWRAAVRAPDTRPTMSRPTRAPTRPSTGEGTTPTPRRERRPGAGLAP